MLFYTLGPGIIKELSAKMILLFATILAMTF